MSKRDKFLTEAMGNCWHEFNVDSPDRYENWDNFVTSYSGYWNNCIKCGEDHIEEVANSVRFDTWKSFGDLWEWVQKQSWYDHFMWQETPFQRTIEALSGPSVKVWDITPDGFANKVTKYLKKISQKELLEL